MACGAHCSPIPSPHHPPASLPQPFLSNSTIRLGYGDHTYQIHLFRVAMIVIACTVGVVLFLFAMFKIRGNYYSRRYYLRRRNLPILFDINGDSPFSDDDDQGLAIHQPIWFVNTVGLHQSIIASITVCKYRKEEGLVEGTECSVCLCEFQEDESLRLLPKCSHAFHIPCIDTWLTSHKNCPVCRAPIVPDTAGTEVSVTEPDSSFSGQTHMENLDGGVGNHQVGEGESSEVRVGDDDTEDGGVTEVSDKNLLNSDKMNCHSARELEEEIQAENRSVSVHSSPA